MRKLYYTVVITAAFLSLFSSLATADAPALSFVAGTPVTSGSNQVYGWIFSVDTPISVTSLGVYDQGADGLAISHDVGIFRQSSQALLGSATVPAGTVGTLIDSFRFESVTPFSLTPDTYLIAMTMPAGNADAQLIDCYSLSISSQIKYIKSAFGESSDLAFPNRNYNGSFAGGMFGANFLVPDPGSTCLLIAPALLGLLALRRKFRS